MTSDDALFEFESEPALATPAVQVGAWRVLVVDDEPDVHAATDFALEGVEILGRPLTLLHADTAEQAYERLRDDPEIAVVLLDVVMESPDAGLRLVGRIREDLGNRKVRIILRTGQPGYAPEMQAVRDYDINDYRGKGELTRTRLYTSLTAALRTWSQLDELELGRAGLEHVVSATRELLDVQGVAEFAEGVLRQLSAWLRVGGPGMVCARWPRAEAGRCEIVAARGEWTYHVGAGLDDLVEADVVEAVRRAFRDAAHQHGDSHFVLYFASHERDEFAVVVPLPENRARLASGLLALFGENMALCARQLRLIERLTDSAYVDPMLGIPNRTALLRLMAERQQRPGGELMLIDLVQFAETNETFGFHYADDLLRAISARLVERFGDTARVARVAGDIFALVGDAAVVRSRHVHALFAAPLPVQGEQHIAAVCTGSVRLAADVPAQDLIKDASMALKTAKSLGPGSHQEFVAGIATATSERTRLLHELRAGFESGSLFLVYQPQVALASGHCIGFEALLRWRNERGELISPDRFVPIAEQSGLIVPMGIWALEQACATLARLRALGHADYRMAVNVSPAQLQSEQFPAQVASAVRRHGIDPARLEIEVTESIAILGADRASSLLSQLRELGVSVALDDFGTGYSSLSYLQRLPLDRIKIDRAFISPMLEQPQSARLVDVILMMGHELGLTLVAEGVENADQATRLRALGCHEAQGFHFARPMDADQLLEWLATDLAQRA